MRLLCLLVVAACASHNLADLDQSYTSSEARHTATNEACPEIVHPHLWRIERAGHSSYLFGTHHIGVGMDRLPTEVTEAFDNVHVVAFETLDDDHSGSIAEPTRPLSAELGPKAWSRFLALVGREHADDAEALSPTAAIVVLSSMYVDTDNMLDEELEATARRREQRLVALESGADVLPVFQRWFGVRMLRAAVMSSHGRRELRESSLKSLRDYCSGRQPADFDDIEGSAEFSAAEIRAMRYELVDARNRAWLPRLEELFDAGDAFVAVGVAHLYHPAGVLALLRARGYTVTRV